MIVGGSLHSETGYTRTSASVDPPTRQAGGTFLSDVGRHGNHYGYGSGSREHKE
jgi:hypothetical protein